MAGARTSNSFSLPDTSSLEEEEKATFTRAIQVLKEALGPGSKILAAQDFRYTTQEETESVSSFVRRLKRTFRVAYKLSAETKAAFLYGQLQEGLKHNLMNSPNVSGALTYKELVMAAKNEERRQSELKKRRQYQNPPKATTSSTATTKTSPASASTNQSKPPNPGRSSRFCNFCRKPGHRKRDCCQRISLRALAVAHTLVNPLIPLIKLVLRQYKSHLLPILKQSPRYRILCPYSIRHLTRVIAFVQSESRMRVVAPTTLKSSYRVYSLKALLIAAPILPLWVLAYFRKLLLLTG